MANSISNIKMTNPIKGIVSKRRKRYVKDGFNLDLAFCRLNGINNIPFQLNKTIHPPTDRDVTRAV
ncbi:Phosphatidylinositol-3,4,5-trisphosphate 3-phosphatase PTEN [Danaus plexippus plexippus]|uniref:Phosphatidylinositol-3,4,5-trisphosphate 3-phosphatase PTEN n=1 Tax=Danaus plexippus plexippus TaxID=278856 RepID=A0A212EQA4_DANPL|nr:Phosphatidylinositol-3,4,5-trisphosphate 3-phosphatase PTEN [Danaus plexippus plexippus]